MPVVSLDGLRFYGIAWTLKFKKQTYRDHYMAFKAICHYILETSIWSCRMIKLNILMSVLLSNISFFQEEKHVACSYKRTDRTISHSLDTAGTPFRGKCNLSWLSITQLLESKCKKYASYFMSCGRWHKSCDCYMLVTWLSLKLHASVSDSAYN